METWYVRITSVGPKKINVIKAVRCVTDRGLKEAKDLVESVEDVGHRIIRDWLPKAEAEAVKQVMESQGATVEMLSNGNYGTIIPLDAGTLGAMKQVYGVVPATVSRVVDVELAADIRAMNRMIRHATLDRLTWNQGETVTAAINSNFNAILAEKLSEALAQATGDNSYAIKIPF